MNKWNIVHECDLEDGTPTEWSIKVEENKFFWIDKLDNETFDVIDSDCHTILTNCKTLNSAKKWVENNLL